MLGEDFYHFFDKQKTAYDMRISDWSSDVCSSDLRRSHSRCRIRSCDGCRAPGRDAASCRLCGPAMPPYCWSAAMTFSPEGPYGTIVTGPPVEQANAAIILLHGRGQRAQAMLELARQLDLPSVAWLALQAPAGAWYSPKYDGFDPDGDRSVADACTALAERSEEHTS